MATRASASVDPVRCRVLSRRVEGLAAGALLAQLALLLLIVAVGRGTLGVPATAAALLITWLVWLALQFENYRLVRCGSQAVRFAASPRLVNRPDFAVRAAFHLIVNWSIVATTLAAAWLLEPTGISRYLISVAVLATVFVWTSFNLLHRQMNRRRNLGLSTTVAAALLAVAWLLGRDA